MEKLPLFAMEYLVECRSAYDSNSLEWEAFNSGERTLIVRGALNRGKTPNVYLPWLKSHMHIIVTRALKLHLIESETV